MQTYNNIVHRNHRNVNITIRYVYTNLNYFAYFTLYGRYPILTKAQEQRVDGDGVHVEERGRYHPRADGHKDHGQPFEVEDGRFVDERELFDRFQRFVEFKVKRRYGCAGYDNFSGEKYEIGHLKRKKKVNIK